ncbi:hypothetical protein Tco_0892059 [Tanacetum coccineum]|uniref:Uncharacterized protein n=1 Tax=Tanacetum coccineum TaxID=301880 RepID=A0ABQ5C7U4_9ASTR
MIQSESNAMLPLDEKFTLNEGVKESKWILNATKKNVNHERFQKSAKSTISLSEICWWEEGFNLHVISRWDMLANNLLKCKEWRWISSSWRQVFKSVQAIFLGGFLVEDEALEVILKEARAQSCQLGQLFLDHEIEIEIEMRRKMRVLEDDASSLQPRTFLLIPRRGSFIEDGVMNKDGVIQRGVIDRIRIDAFWERCNRPINRVHACSFAWNTEYFGKMVEKKNGFKVSNDEGNRDCLVDVSSYPNTLVEFEDKQRTNFFVDIQKAIKVDGGKDLGNVGVIKEGWMNDTIFMKKASFECLTSGSEDEEYAMAVRDFKKFFKRRGRFVRQPRNDKKTFQRSHDDKNGKSDRKFFRCGDPNHLIGECPKPPKDKNQKAFVCSKSSYFSDENSSIDDLALDNEYDKLCKMSLKIITKNKRLKNTRNSLEKEIRELKDKLSTLEKNKGVDLECTICQSLKIENEKLKEESARLNKFEKSTHCLNEMLSSQKPSGDKLGLGFNSFEASSSGTKEIKFVKAQKKVSSDGGPINMGGPQSTQAAPKIIMGPPPATPGSEKSVSFQKSILGPRPKHIIVNKATFSVASAQ